MRPAQQPVRCEINVAPLVDVCLVLLIVFMVVTPLLIHGSAVDLPVTRRPDRLAEPEDQLRLAIDHRGDIFLGETLVAPDHLLAALRAAGPARSLAIRADRRRRYREVRDVLAIASRADFDGAQLVAIRRER